jgi:proline iminopeptidase
VKPVYRVSAPNGSGRLAVGAGHELYWEERGDPAGRPAVVLHGGPGSGAASWWAGLLDPAAYRIVLFDQRGCGRSTPDAGDPGSDLAANTTQHLIADVERLRELLGVERWLVLGGSWGSTLALAYAQRQPRRVAALVLFSVATTTAREVEWVTRGVGRLFPAEWERFVAGVPLADRDGDLAAAYARLLADPDAAVRERAARDWCAWEDRHVRTRPDQEPDPRYADPAFRMRFARLVTHYWRNAAFLADGELLAGVARLAGVPCVLVHGRLDVSSPLDVPWRLARAWPGCELVVIEDEGHGAGPATSAAVIAATDRFRAAR